MGRFRLGLLGAGRMGRTHLRALATSAEVEVVAAADASPACRAAVPLPASAVFHDVAAMLAAGGLDGVLIATPTASHLAMVQQVAAAGLPILCEKPCGLTAAQAAEAAAVAEAAGVRLQVAYWRRFVPALQRLRQEIAAGELGQLYHVACWQWDGAPPARAFRSTAGGIFTDMGVHELDQMRWLTGQEPADFTTAASTVAIYGPVPGDPDSVQALCRLSRGATGLISLGRRFPPGDSCWVQVFGTAGHRDCRFLWPPEGDEILAAALRAQAADFARAVGGAASEGATGADAIATLAAVEAITARAAAV